MRYPATRSHGDSVGLGEVARSEEHHAMCQWGLDSELGSNPAGPLGRRAFPGMDLPPAADGTGQQPRHRDELRCFLTSQWQLLPGARN
jgi:hypothetical protein